MAAKKIVIVGGGNAGLSVASQLIHKDKTLQISIIEPSEKHYYQPAWTLVGAGVFDINKTIHNEADVMPKGVKWIKQKVVSFQPESSSIVLDNHETIGYDFLVVAPGIQLNWNEIKGLK